MKGAKQMSMPAAFRTIVAQEGVSALYRGMGANAIKIVPFNGIRMLSYDILKTQLIGNPNHK